MSLTSVIRMTRMTRENVTHRTVLMQNMMIVVIYFPSLYLLLFLFIIFLFPYYINIFPMTLRQFSQTFYFFFPKNRNRLCCCYFHLPFHTGHILSFHSKTASFVCLRSLCLLYKASLIRQISSHSLISEYLSVDSQNN